MSTRPYFVQGQDIKQMQVSQSRGQLAISLQRTVYGTTPVPYRCLLAVLMLHSLRMLLCEVPQSRPRVALKPVFRWHAGSVGAVMAGGDSESPWKSQSTLTCIFDTLCAHEIGRSLLSASISHCKSHNTLFSLPPTWENIPCLVARWKEISLAITSLELISAPEVVGSL
jgi:hypothetical protein